MALRDALRDDDRVEWVFVIDNAKVPIVSFLLEGCHFELQYAWLRGDLGNSAPLHPHSSFDALVSVPAKALGTLDHRSLPTIKGLRDVQSFLQLVPNSELFSSTLTAVRVWAKSRGIYSSKFGFLGGYMWNILVGHVLLANPGLGSWQEAVVTFFRTFHDWKWETDTVSLKPLAHNLVKDKGMMKIASCSTPPTGVARNIKLPTFLLLCDELRRGARLLADERDPASWSALFSGVDLFSSTCCLFACICVQSTSLEELQEWQGYVGSRVVRALEKLADAGHWARPICYQWPLVEPATSFGCQFYLILKETRGGVETAYTECVPLICNAFKGWSRGSGSTLHVEVLTPEEIPASVLLHPRPNFSSCYNSWRAADAAGHVVLAF